MSITKTNFCFQARQLLIKWTLQIKRRKISRCKETFSYQNDMIQNKINNLFSIAILLLCNKMLSGHKKVKMVLEMKFQDKTKFKRCIKMIVGRHYCYKGKGIYSRTCSMKCGHFPNVMQEKPLPLPDFSCLLKKKWIAFCCCFVLCSYIIVRHFLH